MPLEMKKFRVQRYITQTELALKTGLSQSYLSQIESGIRNPTLITLERIAKALDCTVSELLGETEGKSA